MIQFLEIFSLVTGLFYVWLQIRQNNWMWSVNILSCAAAIAVFLNRQLWANAGLNTYYCLMSCWGIYAWLRDSRKVKSGELHLKSLTKGIKTASASIALAGGFCLIQLLRALGDPAPLLDGAIGIAGIIGTWWLAQSYLENWMIWLVADALGVALCISQGLWWMAGLYAVYVAASVWGWHNWNRYGKLIS